MYDFFPFVSIEKVKILLCLFFLLYLLKAQLYYVYRQYLKNDCPAVHEHVAISRIIIKSCQECPSACFKQQIRLTKNLKSIFINTDVLYCHTLYLAKKKIVFSSCFKALTVVVEHSELIVSRMGCNQSIQKTTCAKRACKRRSSEFQLLLFTI